VVVAQQAVEQVDRLRRDEVLVLGVDEFGPRLARMAAEQPVKVRVELEVILVEVVEELVGAEHLNRRRYEKVSEWCPAKKRMKRIRREG